MIDEDDRNVTVFAMESQSEDESTRDRSHADEYMQLLISSNKFLYQWEIKFSLSFGSPQEIPENLDRVVTSAFGSFPWLI